MISFNLPRATIGPYGDLICPNCEANILTPPCMRLRFGIGKCSKCKEEYLVTTATANKGNEIYDGEHSDDE